MKVEIHDNLCQGHARCNALCPEVFHLDDLGNSYVEGPDVPAQLETKVRLAAESCPEHAIALADG